MSSVIRRNYHDHIGYIWSEYEDVFITNVRSKEMKNLNGSLFGILKSHYT